MDAKGSAAMAATVFREGAAKKAIDTVNKSDEINLYHGGLLKDDLQRMKLKVVESFDLVFEIIVFYLT